MKTTIILLMAAAISLSAAEANKPKSGATPSKPNPPIIVGDVKPQPIVVETLKLSPNFRGGEFQADVFGVMSRPNLTTSEPRWGAGFGASYFPWRGLGFGVRGVSYDEGKWGGSAIDEGEARLLLRVPIWDRVAPYGFLSGIHNFENDDWGAGSGGGLEFRLNRRIGFFGETGLRITTEGKNDWSTSAGLRIIF